MSYKSFYRYIFKVGNSFIIRKNNEKFGTYNRVEDALYERDRLMAVDWDWDLYMELPETNNNYIHIDLPPFDHDPSYITERSECWVVRGKRPKQKYHGSYNTQEEAKEVALIYNAYVTYVPRKYLIRKKVNGKMKSFGYYDTLDEAEEKVKELMENNWQ